MLYTSKAVGEWLGITDRQVRNLRDQGVLSEVRPGVFDMKVCVRQYLNFKIGNKDDQARLVAARAEREETRGKIEKMRMEEAQGDLHRTEDVERALKTIFANFKNRLETIPTKYASTMAQLTDPAEALRPVFGHRPQCCGQCPGRGLFPKGTGGTGTWPPWG